MVTGIGDWNSTMGTAQKILLFGISALVTALFAVLLIMTAKESREVGLIATIKMGELNEDIINSGIMKYDDINVQGSDVVNCIKEILGDYSASETAPLYLYVETSSASNTYMNGSIIEEVRDFSDTRYIKPTALFDGEVVENINDVIVGIRFIQK